MQVLLIDASNFMRYHASKCTKDGQREDRISLVNKLTIVSTIVRRLDVTHDGRNRGRWRLHAVACFMNFFSVCVTHFDDGRKPYS
jgi:hypothetical protein